MAQFRKKPVVIEAITFDELVAHGRATEVGGYHDMPWSFQYAGQPITHENDDCYLIPTLEGTMRFNRGEMLITGVKGEIYPCKSDIFEATYTSALAADIYDESIVYYGYYGPHTCDLGIGGCKALIVKSGNGYQPIIHLDALTEENNGPAYPNWRWKKHVCEKQ